MRKKLQCRMSKLLTVYYKKNRLLLIVYSTKLLNSLLIITKLYNLYYVIMYGICGPLHSSVGGRNTLSLQTVLKRENDKHCQLLLLLKSDIWKRDKILILYILSYILYWIMYKSIFCFSKYCHCVFSTGRYLSSHSLLKNPAYAG